MSSIIGMLPTGGDELNYIDDLSSGKTQLIRAFGTRLTISTAATGNDIWSGTATTIPIPPDIGEQMSVVSTSDEDGAAGKTGILTLHLHYIDAAGNQARETITMNGKTPVDTVATNIRFVQEIHTDTAGSTYAAVGTITIYKYGSASTIYSQIEPYSNQCLNTARMVPAGKICMLWIFNTSAGGGKAADVRLRTTSHHGEITPRIFQYKDSILLLDSGGNRHFRTPRIYPEFTIIKITAYTVSAAGGANVQAGWEGILIDTPV